MAVHQDGECTGPGIESLRKHNRMLGCLKHPGVKSGGLQVRAQPGGALIHLAFVARLAADSLKRDELAKLVQVRLTAAPEVLLKGCERGHADESYSTYQHA